MLPALASAGSLPDIYQANPGWTATQETIHAPSDGTPLQGVLWKNASATTFKNVAYVIHGKGEHCGRYAQLTVWLESQLDAIYCQDHRGHGKSGGQTGHVDRFDDYVDDAMAAISSLKNHSEFQSAKFHLIAHSMGGLVALRLLRDHPEAGFSSATVSSPMMKVVLEVNPLKKALAGFLSWIAPRLTLDAPIPPEILSHDPEVVRQAAMDPMVNGKTTPRFYTESLAAQADLFEKPLPISIPVFMIIAGSDQVVSASAGKEISEKIVAPGRKVIEYSGNFHENFNELNREEIFSEVGRWIGLYSEN